MQRFVRDICVSRVVLGEDKRYVKLMVRLNVKYIYIYQHPGVPTGGGGGGILH